MALMEPRGGRAIGFDCFEHSEVLGGAFEEGG